MKRLLTLALLLSLAVFSGAISAQEDMTYTVAGSGNAELGSFLVDADGMTLYIFTNDEAGVSNCTGDCAVAWPPLTIEEGTFPSLDPSISGEVRTIAREDGSLQVTYNGMPLYYWQDDAEPGDTTGHTLGDVWFVASMPTVGLAGNESLGEFLVDENGMTLYIFTNDEAGVSNCNDDCATAWPPLTVESEDDLALQAGLTGDFSVIERADGSLQVAVNGMPLYYWQDDAAPGDATGHTLGDVWFVAKLPTIANAESEEFGNILVGANGLSLYIFTNDEAGVSNCNDDCAAAWPPVLIAADEEIVVAEDVSGEFTSIERADGSLQVSYNGMPLYYWINDVVAGDTTGHTLGDVWFVAETE